MSHCRVVRMGQVQVLIDLLDLVSISCKDRADKIQKVPKGNM